MYALRVLRAHGLLIVPSNASIGLSSKLLYASSSSIGFTNDTDRQKVQSFVNRSKHSGFCDNELEDFDTLCAASDERLFNTILNRPDHVYYVLYFCPLIPPNSSFAVGHTAGN